MSLSILAHKAETAARYFQLRADRPDVPARFAFGYVTDAYPDAQNIDQAMCRHHWAHDDMDRCYCLNCGADGDA